MNLLNPLPLPQIVPPPSWPKPNPTRLSRRLAGNMYADLRCQRGQNRVTRVSRDNVWGTVLLVQTQKVAILLKDYINGTETCYLFLVEPAQEIGDQFKISRKSLYDRYNALLLRGGLPTLHQLNQRYWVFTDGVVWTGRRLFKFSQVKAQTEKEILHNILTLHP